MSAVLEQSLELIAGYLAPPLFPPDAMTTLREAAQFATSDVRLGLECRLDETVSPDLSQLIEVPDGGADRLGALARARAATGDARAKAIWGQLDALARAAASGDAPVNSIWLEYDLGRGLGPSSVPSVFTGLANGCTADGPTIGSLLRRLGAADPDGSLQDNLARAAEGAASFGGRLRRLCGVMLARENQSRIMILGIPPEAQVDYLLSIGWEGDVRGLAGILKTLGPLVGDVPLSLELSPALQSRVGLEMLVHEGTVDPDTRERLLDALVARGLCSAPKRDALLSWAGRVTPPTAERNRWPESLLLESLLHPEDEFGVFQRTLNHVKIAAGGSHAVAKVYLGLVHAWVKAVSSGYAHAV